MTTIYLIRHAEAEGNLYRRIHGHYDSLITLRGRKQIEALRQRFESIHIDAVYSSDLYRTRATATAITAGRSLQLLTSPRLREVNMGIWEDATWGDVERTEPLQLEHFNNDPLLWKVAGAEHFDDLQNRLADMITEIAARHDGETVAVVSHGSAIRTYMARLLEIPPQEIRRIKHCDNTAVALLKIGGGTTELVYAGDNSHLSEELSTFAHQKWWRENTTFDSTNLRFEPFDLVNDAARYLEYRRDAFPASSERDSLQLSQLQKNWLSKAESHAAAHPRAVSLALIGDVPVGMIELDVMKGEAEKTGDIEFFYMIPEHRRMGMTVQQLGQAVSIYRPLGRERLRMAVDETNEQALRFCTKYGFIKTGELIVDGFRQYVMEMDITLRQI